MKLKKVLAATLAGTMVMASVVSVSAATTALEVTDLTIEAGFSAHTGENTLSGDFDVTYTFYNVGCVGSSDEQNYYNYILEMHNGAESATFIDVRADNYGWLYNADESESLTFGDGLDEDGWAEWLTAMKAGSECTVNVVRSGNTFTVTCTAAGSTFTASTTVEEFDGCDTTIYITGEYCQILAEAPTSTTTTSESSETSESSDSSETAATTQKTTQAGDAAPVAAVAVALLGCAAIAFASKKKMA